MKRCTKCGIEKVAGEFSKDKSRKDGLCSRCKACNKLYKEANKERRREQSKLYREANKEQILEYQKLYYEANKERKKLYREANKERRREYFKLHYEANKERYREQNRVNNAKESLRRDEIYIKARIKNGYTREEATILRGIYKAINRGEQNRDTCDQLFMAGLL